MELLAPSLTDFSTTSLPMENSITPSLPDGMDLAYFFVN
jgi:hypothetical protein